MDLKEFLKTIPPWVLTILLFVFMLVFLERVYISKKPIDIFGKSFGPSVSDLSKSKWNIIGTVTKSSSEEPLSAEIYLVLQSGQNDLIQKTDDAGQFSFPEVPQGNYSIIVKNLDDNNSGRILIQPKENQNDLMSERIIDGASLKYKIHDK